MAPPDRYNPDDCVAKHRNIKSALGLMFAMMVLFLTMVGLCLAYSTSSVQVSNEAVIKLEKHLSRGEVIEEETQNSLKEIKEELKEHRKMLERAIIRGKTSSVDSIGDIAPNS